MSQPTLRGQVAIGMSGIAVVASLVSVVVLARQMGQLQIESVEHDLDNAAQSAEFELTAALEQLRQDVDFLAGLPSVQQTETGWREDLARTFIALAYSRPNYDQIRLVEVNGAGMELVRVDRHGPDGEIRVVDQADLQSKAARSYVLLGARSEGPWLSEIELNRERGQIQEPENPVVRAVRRIVDAEGAPIAVVVINMRAQDVFAAVDSHVPEKFDLAITNQRGQLLFGMGTAFAFDRGDPSDAFDRYPALAVALGLAARSRQPDLLQQARVGGPPDRSLGIVVSQSRDRAWAMAMRAVRSSVIPAFLLALVLALMATLPIAAAIASPFRVLANQIRRADMDGIWQTVSTEQSEARVVSEAFEHVWSRAQNALRELRSIEDALQQSNARLQEFAYVIAHDMRSPLRGILACVSWIRDDLPDPPGEVDTHLGFIESRASRLGAMIEGVLDYARVTSALPTPESPVDTNEVLEDVLEDLGAHDATITRDSTLPSVWATRDEVQRVLQNLIANAIRHAGPHASIHVAAERSKGFAGFSIADRGPGVPDDLKEEIFQLLRTGPGASDSSVGIGLSIAAQLVERRKGFLKVEDRPGGGAIFRVGFPVVAKG